jgi:hypothetical protein
LARVVTRSLERSRPRASAGGEPSALALGPRRARLWRCEPSSYSSPSRPCARAAPCRAASTN